MIILPFNLIGFIFTQMLVVKNFHHFIEERVVKIIYCVSTHSHLSPGTLACRIIPMYHQQQNKWYSQRCSLARFETTVYFSNTEFTCT